MTYGVSVSAAKAENWTGASLGGYLPGQNAGQDDDPSQPIGAYFAMLPAWQTMRAVLEGNQYLKQISRDYIPALPNESDECYQRRLSQSLFSPYTSRVVDAAIGLILRKPITLEGGNEAFWEDFTADVDRQGTDLMEFTRKLLRHSIGYGHSSLIVDYPKAQGIRTLADERNAKLMPYFTAVEPWQVIGWRNDTEKSGSRLEQIRIRELTTRPRGEFGEEVVEMIRVLEPGKYRLFERTGSDARWVEVESGRTSLDQIPLVTTYSDKEGVLVSKPPLLDVGYINLAHYRLQSQHINALSVAGFPILQLKGWDSQDQNIQIDVSKALAFGSDAGAGASYVEPSNAAFSAYETELEALAQQMSNLGISILAQQKNMAESGLSKALDRADTNSMLATISQDVESTLQKAFDLAAEYAGQEPPIVGLSRDFDTQTMDSQGITAINTLFTSGLIDQETALSLLHQGEILADDVDIEEILSRAEIEQEASMERDMARLEGEVKIAQATEPNPDESEAS